MTNDGSGWQADGSGATVNSQSKRSRGRIFKAR